MRIRHILKTGILNILFQIAFLLLIYTIGSSRTLGEGEISNYLLLFLLVLIPSLIWTVFFYLQDRLNPEPLSYLAASFLAGMAAAALTAVPLTQTVFRLHSWIYASSSFFILGSFLITASIFSILIYLILRYGFYSRREFDEPVDGMIYGAISGAGFAFVMSFHHLSLNPSYTLFFIAYIAATNILIYSTVGSVIGYAMGTAKFRGKNIQIFSLIGIVLGIVLLGIYHLVNEFIFISGFEHAFWLSFSLTILYALSILIFSYMKMRKLTRKDHSRHIPVWSKFDPWITGVIAILLSGAMFVSIQGMKGTKYENKAFGISFYYPHSLSPLSFNRLSLPSMPLTPEANILFHAESDTPPHYSFLVVAYSLKPQKTQPEWTQFIEVSETESLMLSDTFIGGLSSKRLSYSYLEKRELTDVENDCLFPRLIQVHTDIINRGGHLILLTFKVASEDSKAGLPQHRKILESVTWKEPKGG